MDSPSLFVAVMPTLALVVLCTGIALTNIAGRGSGRGHAGEWLARADAFMRVAAGRKSRPQEPGVGRADAAEYLYVPCARRVRQRPRGRDAPLGPGGADRQEDGKLIYLRQRQLEPVRGRCQPRLHQPRAVRGRHPRPSRVPARCDPRFPEATALDRLAVSSMPPARRPRATCTAGNASEPEGPRRRRRSPSPFPAAPCSTLTPTAAVRPSSSSRPAAGTRPRLQQARVT